MSIEAQHETTDFQDYIVERAKARADMQNALRGTVGVLVTEEEFRKVQSKHGLYPDMDYEAYLDFTQSDYFAQRSLLGSCDFVRIRADKLHGLMEDSGLEQLDIDAVHLFADMEAAGQDLRGTDLSLDEWLRYERLLDAAPEGADMNVDEVGAVAHLIFTPHHLGPGVRALTIVHDTGEVDAVSAMIDEDGVEVHHGDLDTIWTALHVAYYNGGRVYASARFIREEDEAHGQAQMTFRFGSQQVKSLDGELLEMLANAPGMGQLFENAEDGHYHVTLEMEGLCETVLLTLDVDDDGIWSDVAGLDMADLLIASGVPMTILAETFPEDDEEDESDLGLCVTRMWRADMMKVTPMTAGEAFKHQAVTDEGDLRELDPDTEFADAWDLDLDNEDSDDED